METKDLHMEKEEVTRYLDKETDFSNFRVVNRFKGEHNQNFVFSSKGKKYVLRKNREIVQNLSLRKERRILKFLDYKEIDFVPESFYYDRERDIHIIGFIGEREVYLPELEDDLLEEWVQKIAEIHDIKFEQYKGFCNQKGYTVEKPDLHLNKKKTALDYLDYAEERLEIEGISEWVRTKLGKLSSSKDSPQKLYLRHSDLCGSTRNGGEICLIDWEFAGFTNNPEHDLMEIFQYRDLDNRKVEKIKNLYNRKRKLPENFEQEFENYSKLNSIFQVTWRLKKAAELKEYGGEWKNQLDKARVKKKGF